MTENQEHPINHFDKALQTAEQSKFREIGVKYAELVTHLEEWVKAIPDWVPVIGPLLHGKLQEVKSSIAMGFGIDPKTGEEAANLGERLKLVGEYQGKALLDQAKSLYEVLLLVGTGGAGGAAEVATAGFTEKTLMDFLGKVAGKDGAAKVVDMLPDAINKLLPFFENKDKAAADAIKQLARLVGMVTKNPQCKESMVAMLEEQEWWQELQGSLNSGAKQADIAQEKMKNLNDQFAQLQNYQPPTPTS